jgi:hypothetical protein
VAEIVAQFAPSSTLGLPLRPEQRRALRDIVRCRTAELGGHLDVCSRCGYERPSYNSCRNRHCPKCQALRQHQWLEQRIERIVPTHYFHVVFTVPSELHPLCRRHGGSLFALLFEAASQTLLELGRDPQWLGAQLGISCVLHTWSRSLAFHPHVHCVVTGGGLSPDRTRWVAAPPDFLFPVQVCGSLFRGKFLTQLRGLAQKGALGLDEPEAFERLIDSLYRKKWVVYAKRPFGGPEQVFRYLGRYTHRIAISNHRIVCVDEHTVVFKTKHGQTATVSPLEFVRRFVQHVLPPRFVRIRHYGLMAPSNVHSKLQTARALLDQGSTCVPRRLRRARLRTFSDVLYQLTGIDLSLCPRCALRTLSSQPLPPTRAPPAYA